MVLTVQNVLIIRQSQFRDNQLCSSGRCWCLLVHPSDLSASTYGGKPNDHRWSFRQGSSSLFLGRGRRSSTCRSSNLSHVQDHRRHRAYLFLCHSTTQLLCLPSCDISRFTYPTRTICKLPTYKTTFFRTTNSKRQNWNRFISDFIGFDPFLLILFFLILKLI